jgi:hypothetical protein
MRALTRCAAAWPDTALNDNIWYYKDRAGVARGPCTLTTVRKAWVHGVIDQYTLMWGQGLEAWYPMRNVVGLVTNVQSLDGAPSRLKKPSIRRRPPGRARRAATPLQRRAGEPGGHGRAHARPEPRKASRRGATGDAAQTLR